MAAAGARLLSPDEALKRSIAALKHGSYARDFGAVVSALRVELEHQSKLCQSHGEPVLLYRAQGAAQTLSKLMDIIEEAGK